MRPEETHTNLVFVPPADQTSQAARACAHTLLRPVIFFAFDWFRISMHDHLLILTHVTLTLHTRSHSIYSFTEAVDKKRFRTSKAVTA